MALSNYEKFKLLIWKNWIIDLNNRLLFVIELTLPVVCCTLAVLIRIVVPKEEKTSKIYNQSFGLDNLNLFRDIISGTMGEQSLKYELAYSPKSNKLFESIITEAAASLELGYRGYPNSIALEDGVQNQQIFAGIDFYDKMAAVKEYPKKFAYSIRFPSELRTAFSKIQPWCTHLHFVQGDSDGPRNIDDPDGGIPAGYLREGFLAVQNAVSTTFIKQSSNTTEELPPIELQRFPFAHYVEDPLTPATATFLGLIILQSYAYLCTYTIRCVTLEKEKRLKEVMKIMGISSWIHWVAWFAKSFIMMGISSFFIAFVLTHKWSKGVAVLEKSSFSMLFFFLIIYTIASIMFCFTTATLFERVDTAVAVTGLIWVMQFLPFVYFRLHYFNVDLNVKLIFAMFANTAMGLGVHVISGLEHKGEGLQWGNLSSEVSLDDKLSMAHIIKMMILSSVFSLITCLYVEQIYPGEVGLPQPWTFPFRKDFWFCGNSSMSQNRRSSKLRRDNQLHFESEPLDRMCGVQARNLTKIYPKKVAVSNLTIDLYENEITVLLGKTGSGKTTVVEMLAGMIPPTSGTAFINGHDITQNLADAHESMSICMEYNLLFEDLTVRDNMVFFSRLKGMSGIAMEDDIDRLISSMGLEEVETVITSSLSSSMQRKLSVCTAFCGSPKVVLCDGPSKGMDPEARIDLWNFLCSEKIKRTILVTTRMVEEADALGDRIAILGNGVLKCMGTPIYLKKAFGVGYRLTCSKGENFDIDAVSIFLHNYIPNMEPVAVNETEAVYQIITNNNEIYQTLITDLETNAQLLSITGFSISMTSLRDVLISANADEAPETDEADSVNFDLFNKRLRKNKAKLRSLKWTALLYSQWNGMLLKKHLEKLSHMGIITIQTILPVICVFFTMFVGTGHEDIVQTPFTFELSNYPSTVTVLDSFDPTAGPFEAAVAQNYRTIVDSHRPHHFLEETNQESFIIYLLNRGQTIQDVINKKFIVGASIHKSKFIAWMNNKPLHSAPLSVNLIHNAIARTLLGPSVEIEVTNAPVPYSIEAALRHASDDKMGSELGMNLSLCMSFVCTLYCVFLIKEKTDGAKLLQIISGVNPLTFWSTNFTWDMLTFTAAVIVLLLVLGFFQIKGFNSFGDLGRTCIVLLLFGWAALPLVYFLSIFFTEPSVGYARITLLCVFIGFILFAFLLLTKGYDVEFRAQMKVDEFEKLARFSPFYQMACGVRNLHANSRIRQLCEPLIKKHILQDRCRIYPQCCAMTSFFSTQTPGIGSEVGFLCLSGILYFLLIICVEHFRGTVIRHKKSELKLAEMDEDVFVERQSVQAMGKRRHCEHRLVVDKLTKYHGKELIINNVSFAVKPAECFGMVGVRGAGKSTVLKILVGCESMSSGRVFVQGQDMRNKRNAVLKQIGYCPEKYGLFDEFTGKDTLRIYGLIHGIPAKKLNKFVTYMAKAFGFHNYLNCEVRLYSECNKRRLGIALAIMSNPVLVYIDNPSRGMGPIAKHRLWKMIRNLRDSGMSVIIGSSELQECKAVCNSLAIMANGKFRCFGTLQHLKLKFANGLILKIKISSMPGDPQPLVLSDSLRIQDFIQSTFSTAVLQENALSLLKYYFPMEPMLRSRIFHELEENKENLKIEAYSIDQMSLEEVFLEMTKLQEGGRRVYHPTKLHRFLSILAYM